MWNDQEAHVDLGRGLRRIAQSQVAYGWISRLTDRLRNRLFGYRVDSFNYTCECELVEALKILDGNRVLAEVELEPVQGSRFQPTGFPNLGPAEFVSPSDNGEKALLVESAQSMANRLEKVCMNNNSDLVDSLEGLPFIIIKTKDGGSLTNSILEAHRMNSPYILKDKKNELRKMLKTALKIDGKKHLPNIPEFAKFVFKYDTNSVLHGVFLADKNIAGGRYKLTRSLSAFIEATGIENAVSGGVKLDRLDPTGGKKRAAETYESLPDEQESPVDEEGGKKGAAEGYGHIPFSRVEYTAKSIKAYFNIDLSLIRSYKLAPTANDLLFTFALWKIQRLLNTDLRLRTACDLQIKAPIKCTTPNDFSIPDLVTLNKDMIKIIKKCKDEDLFCEPIVITRSP